MQAEETLRQIEKANKRMETEDIDALMRDAMDPERRNKRELEGANDKGDDDDEEDNPL